MIDALSLVTAAFSSWRTDELIEHNKPTLQVYCRRLKRNLSPKSSGMRRGRETSSLVGIRSEQYCGAMLRFHCQNL